MKVYGYVRVSSIEQNEDRQLDAMSEMKVSESQIYVDKQSGKDFKRPAWCLLIKIGNCETHFAIMIQNKDEIQPC